MSFNVTSLGRKTDLIFSRANGQVVDRGEYLLIQTPENPGFYWGNYVLFQDAPREGDFKRWTDLFRREFPYYSTIKHMVFAWQEPRKGDVSEFLASKFRLTNVVVLATQEVQKTERFNASLRVQPILTESQWSTVLEDSVRDNTEHDPISFRKFKEQQLSDYKKLQEAGKGQWYGAYIEDELVGNCGVFFEDGLARFQQVITNEEHRNKGVCNTLVYEVSMRALTRSDVHTLVMEADVDYHAAKIYEGIGFKPTETNYALEWWERG